LEARGDVAVRGEPWRSSLSPRVATTLRSGPRCQFQVFAECPSDRRCLHFPERRRSGNRIIVHIAADQSSVLAGRTRLGTNPLGFRVKPGQPPVKILLIEDNLDDAELTIRALGGCHSADHLGWAQSGTLALDFLFQRGAYAIRAGRETPRLILLDLKLPRLDGLEVLAQIRMSPRTSRIPVVILSSSAEQRDIARSYDLGANSYITKPVEFQSFAKSLGEIALYWLSVDRSTEPP
jgi:two-component system, response regulator